MGGGGGESGEGEEQTPGWGRVEAWERRKFRGEGLEGEVYFQGGCVGGEEALGGGQVRGGGCLSNIEFGRVWHLGRFHGGFEDWFWRAALMDIGC